MTHNLNHREQPVQKAGQTDGAAPPPSPDHAAIFREGTTLVVPYGWGDRRASARGTVVVQIRWRGPRRWRRDHEPEDKHRRA
jgi:hypothetical protein